MKLIAVTAGDFAPFRLSLYPRSATVPEAAKWWDSNQRNWEFFLRIATKKLPMLIDEYCKFDQSRVSLMCESKTDRQPV